MSRFSVVGASFSHFWLVSTHCLVRMMIRILSHHSSESHLDPDHDKFALPIVQLAGERNPSSVHRIFKLSNWCSSLFIRLTAKTTIWVQELPERLKRHLISSAATIIWTPTWHLKWLAWFFPPVRLNASCDWTWLPSIAKVLSIVANAFKLYTSKFHSSLHSSKLQRLTVTLRVAPVMPTTLRLDPDLQWRELDASRSRHKRRGARAKAAQESQTSKLLQPVAPKPALGLGATCVNQVEWGDLTNPGNANASDFFEQRVGSCSLT